MASAEAATDESVAAMDKEAAVSAPTVIIKNPINAASLATTKNAQNVAPPSNVQINIPNNLDNEVKKTMTETKKTPSSDIEKIKTYLTKQGFVCNSCPTAQNLIYAKNGDVIIIKNNQT